MTQCYDHTELSCLAGCEQEWAFRHQQGLRPTTPNASQHFGSAVHAGLKALFDNVIDYPLSVAAAWGDFVAPSKKPWLTLAYAQDVVAKYVTGYFSEAYRPPFELVANEQYLEWPERQLCGIVDRVVRAKSDGALYVMDTKTTGLYLSSAWFEQWRHSLQAAIYLDLVEHVMGEPVAGFWVDAIHVNKRGYAKGSDYMRVGPFAYDEGVRQELWDRAARLIGTVDYLEQRPKYANKNPSHCFRYNALCPFFEYCTLAPSVRQAALDMSVASGELVVERWDPQHHAAS